MDSKICVGDNIIIMRWAEKNYCEWQKDFDKSFKVIGFIKDLSNGGPKKYWVDVSSEYGFIDLSNINSTPMEDIPFFLLDGKLSNDKNIIHPVFVEKDYKESRINKINNIVDE